MKRFITMHMPNDSVLAFEEGETFEREADICEEYVWQFAVDKEAAKAQHFAKHDEWYEDVHNGKLAKDTY